jgi:hypothetical protein
MAARRPVRSFRAALAPLALVSVVLVAGCNGNAKDTIGGSPAASRAAGAGSPGGSAAAGASSGTGATGASPGTPGEADPAASLLIASPYTLASLPAATAANLQATFTRDLGAFGKAVRVGVRAVARSGATESFVLAVAFPTQTLDLKTYGDVVATLEAGAEQQFAEQVISNVQVTVGTLSSSTVGLFRKGDTLVIVLGSSRSLVVPAITALIAANG